MYAFSRYVQKIRKFKHMEESIFRIVEDVIRRLELIESAMGLEKIESKHCCRSTDYKDHTEWKCDNEFVLSLIEFQPVSHAKVKVKFCPFCGTKAKANDEK
jgi:hypothetical protein